MVFGAVVGHHCSMFIEMEGQKFEQQASEKKNSTNVTRLTKMFQKQKHLHFWDDTKV